MGGADRAIMRLDDVNANRQPQTGAAAGAIAGAFGTVKTFKQFFQLRVLHAGCGIREGKGKAPVFLSAGNQQPAAAVGIAQAVFQQVVEQLHQPIFVAKHHRAVRQGEVDFQVATGKAFAEGAARHLQHVNDVYGRLLVGQCAFVGHGELVEIVHQLGERAHLRLQGSHRFGRKLAHAVLNGLELAAQHRQRRTQLV